MNEASSTGATVTTTTIEDLAEETGTISLGTSVPDCPAEDDVNFAQGDPNEASLAAALTRIDTGTCPPSPAMEKLALERIMPAPRFRGEETPARHYLGAH